MSKPSQYGRSGPRVVGPYGEWHGRQSAVNLGTAIPHPDDQLPSSKTRLTTEGRAILDDWLRQYPSPIGLLRHCWPTLYRKCQEARIDDEDIHSACLEGYVLAVIRYIPTRNATLKTAMGWGLLGAVSDMLRKVEPTLAEKPASDSWLGDTYDEDICKFPTPVAKPGPDPDLAEHVAWMLDRAGMTDREREVLISRHMGSESLAVIGEKIGKTKQRTQQIDDEAITKVRRKFGIRTKVEICRERAQQRINDRVYNTIALHGKPITQSMIAKRSGMGVYIVRIAVSQLVRDSRVERHPKQSRQGTNQYRILKLAEVVV